MERKRVREGERERSGVREGEKNCVAAEMELRGRWAAARQRSGCLRPFPVMIARGLFFTTLQSLHPPHPPPPTPLHPPKSAAFNGSGAGTPFDRKALTSVRLL